MLRTIAEFSTIAAATALLAVAGIESRKTPAASDAAALQVAGSATDVSKTLAATAGESDGTDTCTAVVSSLKENAANFQSGETSQENFQSMESYAMPSVVPVVSDEGPAASMAPYSPSQLAPPAPVYYTPARSCSGGNCYQPAAAGQSYQRRGLFRGGFFRRR